MLGIFWKRTTGAAAVAGMVSGLGLTLCYIATHQPWLRALAGLDGQAALWWGVEPNSAAVFGVPLGFAVILLLSWITPAATPAQQALVDRLRSPS